MQLYSLALDTKGAFGKTIFDKIIHIMRLIEICLIAHIFCGTLHFIFK